MFDLHLPDLLYLDLVDGLVVLSILRGQTVLWCLPQHLLQVPVDRQLELMLPSLKHHLPALRSASFLVLTSVTAVTSHESSSSVQCPWERPFVAEVGFEVHKWLIVIWHWLLGRQSSWVSPRPTSLAVSLKAIFSLRSRSADHHRSQQVAYPGGCSRCLSTPIRENKLFNKVGLTLRLEPLARVETTHTAADLQFASSSYKHSSLVS